MGSHLKCAELSEKRAPRRMRRRQRPPEISQGATFAESVRMVVKSGGNWKRPVNRMYTYNFQIGENYYLPITSYLETKSGAPSDVPGPLCFSERISLHPLSGTSVSVYGDQSVETIKKTRQVISNM